MFVLFGVEGAGSRLVTVLQIKALHKFLGAVGGLRDAQGNSVTICQRENLKPGLLEFKAGYSLLCYTISLSK